MPELSIIEVEGIEEERIDVSRWQKYGKDRLYINRFGRSHDSCYVDLTGEDGHSTWSGASFDVDGNRIVIEWREHGVARSKIADGYEPKERRAVLEVN